jgi:hypothetical protein
MTPYVLAALPDMSWFEDVYEKGLRKDFCH